MKDTSADTTQDEISKQLHLFRMELKKSFKAREKHARRMNVIFIIQLTLLVTTLAVTILRLLQ